MLTTSHVAIGYLLFEKKSKKERLWAVIGSLIPDCTFFLVVPVLLVIDRTQLLQAFSEHNDIYMNGVDLLIGETLNSVWLWLLIIIIGYYEHKPLMALGVGGFAHIIVDLLTHKGDWAWNHFFPLAIEPLQGVIDFTDLRFIFVVHTIWAFVFIPKLYKWLKQMPFYKTPPRS